MAGDSARAVASLEPGSRMRLTSIARTRSRQRLASGPRMTSRPMLRAAPSAAATWPCGSERVTVKASCSGGDDGAALEHGAQALDVGGGPVGQVAQGALTDLAVLAVGFAQQDGGGRGAVRDGFDIHGVIGVDSGFWYKSQMRDYMATLWPVSGAFLPGLPPVS